MTDKQTITINGTAYDAHTGLPVQTNATNAVADAAATAPSSVTVTRRHTAASSMHQKTQKSHTLNRKTVQKHAPKKPTRQLDGIVRRAPTRVAQSPAISKFAPKPVVAALPVADLPSQPHPTVVRAQTKHASAQPTPAVHTPAYVTKDTEIKKALAHSAPSKRRAKKSKRTFAMPKVFNIASASLAVLLLAGYFTYLNIPSISVRVAASQAGIDASYPDYQPSGYRLNGPVAYDSGQVSIKFASNTGPQSFTIDQQQTNWDSSALLENYVEKRASDYVPHQKGGLTIYTFGDDAAWVNGGILYTVTGNSQLSDEQILRIATSM